MVLMTQQTSATTATGKGNETRIGIPTHRPYLIEGMKPSEMMRAYVGATWGTAHAQQDLVSAVVAAAGRKGFVPGQVSRSRESGSLGDQKRGVLAWMDWNDAKLAEDCK